MRIINVHTRSLAASPQEVGRLVDSLASANDQLWPSDRWPALRLNKPLGQGASGGHGPIRYYVQTYHPGREVVFRFTEPAGFVGTHGFDVAVEKGGSLLRHVLDMNVDGIKTKLSWALVYRPLHDALIEDLLDRAEESLGAPPTRRARWSLYVRLLRALFPKRRTAA